MENPILRIFAAAGGSAGMNMLTRFLEGKAIENGLLDHPLIENTTESGTFVTGDAVALVSFIVFLFLFSKKRTA